MVTAAPGMNMKLTAGVVGKRCPSAAYNYLQKGGNVMAEESKTTGLPVEEMASENGQVSKEILVASVVAGTAFGAIMAMLYTPKSGQEMRSKISEVTGGATGKVKEFGSRTQEQIMNSINSSKSALLNKKSTIMSAIDAGRDVLKKEKEKLSA